MARSRTSLARSATGLPRYYMDVAWWTGPAWLGATLAEIGLRDAMSSYCSRHGTDGRLPADPKVLAIALAVDAGEVRRTLPKILARTKPDGRPVIDVQGGELVIPGYEDHNPTRAEVEAYSAERSTTGSYGNHVRHHVNKDVVNPACEHCQATTRDPQDPPSDDRSSDRSSDSLSDRSGVAEGSHGMGWDGMGWENPPHLRDDSPPEPADGADEEDQSSAEDHPPPDPPAPRARHARATRLADAIGEAAHAQRLAAGGVTHPSRHRQACIDGARRDHLDAIAALIDAHPDWDDDQLIAHRTRPVIERTTTPLEQSRNAAVLAQQLRDAAPADEPIADRAVAHAAALDARRALQQARRRPVDAPDPGAAA